MLEEKALTDKEELLVGGNLLVTRRQKYRFYRLNGYNMRAAALNAGYSKATADRARQAGLEKTETVAQWLERIGVTQKSLAEYLRAGLDANKVISAVVTGKDADEKTNDFIDVPDWQSRHKYLETALKLKGALNDNPQQPQSIVFNISAGIDTPPQGVIDVKKEDTVPVAISVAV